MLRSKRMAPVQLVGIYALLSFGWIVLSDLGLGWASGGEVHIAWLNIAKGGLFVLVSSAVLLQLVRVLLRRVAAADEARWLAERKNARALERSSRLYATLARANEAALAATDRQRLGEEICRALVENAGMRLAWIGWVDESTKRVQIETAVGPAANYVSELVISVDPACAESRGPTGQAILQRRSFICMDISAEPLMKPWRAHAERHGLRSSAATPLELSDGTRGTLTIYSDEVDFFNAEVIRLVEQLAADHVHGLEMLAVRQQMERQSVALRESEQRWQFALEGAGDGVWDWNVATGAVHYSPRLIAMFGYREGEMHPSFDEWESHIHPDDLAQARAKVSDCLSGRATWLNLEHRLRTKDGSYRWVLSRGKVVERDAAGQPQRMIGTFADITELRRAAQHMTLLETALEAMPAGILITDREGRIEWANAAFTRITGYGAGEILGATPRILNSGLQSASFYAKLWECVLRGDVWSGELVNRRKDGSHYHERMLIAPVTHGGRRGITHFIAIKEDITERRQLEQQLLRSQRMEGIGLLAGGIAHDLNNVLAPILLSVELLRLRCQDPLEHRTLEVIEASARRGTGVVRQVLTFARGIDGERTPLRPRDLVRELVLIIEETFPRTLQISREIPDDVPMIMGDATQLHQVLLNLAVNARDAMPDGGQLAFRVRAETIAATHAAYSGTVEPGDYVVVSVRDSGCGMTPEVRDRIFEPFFTTKATGKGTGLGLPTVLGIVRSHGGFIDVISAPGAGSEFCLYFPALPAEHSEEAPVEAAVQLEGRGRTLLVCDDEAPVREVARLLLAHQGFKVLEAVNGREALDMFEAHGASLDGVVIDIMMPLMTGDRAAVEMLRQRPDLPVLFMSGLMEQDTIQAALKNVSGEVHLLRKPFTARELLGALATVFSERATN